MLYLCSSAEFSSRMSGPEEVRTFIVKFVEQYMDSPEKGKSSSRGFPFVWQIFMLSDTSLFQ